MVSAVPSAADERREEGTSVGQPPGHSDENSGGKSGHERTGDGGPERGWSLMQRPEGFELCQENCQLLLKVVKMQKLKGSNANGAI